MFIFNSLYFKLATLISAIALIVAIFFYYNKMRDDLNTLRQDNELLLQSIQTQQSVISKMQTDIEIVKKINRDVTTQSNKLRKDIDSLNSKFAKNDLGAIAAEKPKIVEKMINRASENVARCFELASGAPLNEKEKNAKSSIEANNECPNLVDSIINNSTN
jgi:septal ring factor EnvC (AmiA/AmiB activator)